ncbi:hypothetical protein [Labrys wisconsinensis]|uniref:Uncharacterized protein n=1 Tax=Labrys wisconsinensis TaxID=425677 RepID=A0ABU0IZ00_9HYPH|nr:hypothetical protein [Labrys wisconsinensis]MDQ0467242.1 hypothetical protein [Labrys wisconsinensis]
MTNPYRSDAYIIEVRGQTAGIVARDGRVFRFHASDHRFNPIDGMAFASPRAAEKAAHGLLAAQARRRRAAIRRQIGSLLTV